MEESQKISITEKRVTEYRITHPYGRQKIYISESRYGGFEFTSSGAWGTYAHYWGSPGGGGWLKFLDSCDDGYLMGKLSSGTVFDPDGTVENLKKEIIAQRREGYIDAEEARNHWEVLTQADADNADAFLLQLVNEIEWEMPEPWEYFTYKQSDSLVGFMKYILRPFIAEMLRRHDQNHLKD